MSGRRLPVAAAVCLLLLGSVAASAQTRTHIIQGHVVSDSGRAILAADVIVTVAPTAEVITGIRRS